MELIPVGPSAELGRSEGVCRSVILSLILRFRTIISRFQSGALRRLGLGVRVGVGLGVGVGVGVRVRVRRQL